MVKKDSHEIREKKAKEYIKKNMFKQILKQKLYELGIIPVGLSIIAFIPYWIGLLFCKMVGKETILNWMNAGVQQYDKISFWYHWINGFFILIILGMIVILNFWLAKSKLEKRASKKFDIGRWDL